MQYIHNDTGRLQLAQRLLLLEDARCISPTSDTAGFTQTVPRVGLSLANIRRIVMCRFTMCVHVGVTIAWFCRNSHVADVACFPLHEHHCFACHLGAGIERPDRVQALCMIPPQGTNDAMEGGTPWRRTWVTPQDFPKLAWPSHRDVHQRGAVTT